MRTLVLLTREPIDKILAGLPVSWRAGPWGGEAEASRGSKSAGPRDPKSAGSERDVYPGDTDRLYETSGAWLDFYGVVRDREDPEDSGPTEHETTAYRAEGHPITAIEYEAHEEMAVHQMERILNELASKYPLNAALVIHRIGRVPVGEASLLVRILSPHRTEALGACAEFIDELKTWVPIWKHPERR